MRTKEKNLRLRNRPMSAARLLPALIAGCFVCAPVWANPTGAQIVNGKVTISSNGNVMTITNTPGAIINWLSFSINPGQVTQFLQQNSSSSVLNRITGQNPSQIFGTLESNGKVYLINPNGILFGQGSQVNVGGLVASSLNISNADFSAGKNNFNSAGQSAGSVVNQGSITTPGGGSIYLIAPQVQNSGVLSSPQGEILLAAGHSVQLMDGADPTIQVLISAPTDKAVNLGQVIAEGGKIGILGALVNQAGVANANSAVVGQHGEIVFKSSQTTMVSGNSQTTAIGTGNSSSGGTIEITGPQVGIVDNAQVNVSGQRGGGKIMVGGDFHGTDPSVENASAVYIGSAAGFRADAIQSGNGGDVAVWSDNVTRMYGTISAQGGAQGGNGGYVETSSKNYLDFRGLVNIKAAQGSAGTLLLDPYDIVIDNSTGTTSGNITCSGCPGGSSVTFTNVGPATPSVVGSTYLATQLATGDVIVSTVAQGGYIAVNSPVSWSSTHLLTLAATGDISINAGVSGVSGKLALTTSGGNIIEGGGGYINVSELSAVANAGNVTLNSATNFASTISGTAGGSAGFQFTSGSNDIVVGTANGVTGINSAGPVWLSAPASAISTAPGASITAPSLNLVAANDIGTQSVPLNTSLNTLDVLQANNVFIDNSGTGNLNVTGIRGTGVVNVGTAGSLTVPLSDAGINFTGSTITLVSAGNMSLGDGNGFSASGGTGAITLMAGFTGTPDSTPVTNLSPATMTQGGGFNGSSIDLWVNSYRDFSGSATYSSTPNYHPGPTPISIYVTGTSVGDKIYDGTTLATLSGGTLVGIPAQYLPGVTWTQSGNFISKNAGTSITVAGNDVLTLAPALAGDFVLVQPTGLSATITPAMLTVSGQTAANKIYDGTTAATLSGGVLSGVVASDSNSILLNQSGNFASANVGSNITVIASDSLSGLGASNYVLVQPTGLAANIVTPAVTADGNYITPLMTSGLVNLAGTSTSSTSSTGSSTTNTGATNNGAPKKLYCN